MGNLSWSRVGMSEVERRPRTEHEKGIAPQRERGGGLGTTRGLDLS
jgi:hypothetical protein